MIDPARFAALICEWCIDVRPGDQVLIGGTPECLELLGALHNRILEADGWPLVRLTPGSFAADFYAHARERHLDGFAPLELAEVEAVDAVVLIGAPANTQELAAVDSALVARVARARAPVQEARLRSRWCGTQWPTAALAQQAVMSVRDYEAFLERALFLDRPDPVRAWQELSARQTAIVERLADVEEIRIEADGTDLRLRVGGRTWINSDGRHNMPSGEVFTGPLEDSAQGTVRFTIPSYTRGTLVEDVALTFRDGEVVSARAARGNEVLQGALGIDAGSRFLGELGIGTNIGIDRPTGSTLLDEKIAGTIHLALGRSYPETGGRNASALHWDLICDLRSGGRVSGDGQPLNNILWPGH